MNTPNEFMLLVAPFYPALIALVLLCLTVLVQNFLTAPLAFAKGEQSPGMPLKGDHELLSFRVVRTYANSVEVLPAFGFVLMVAILIGVNSNVVNWLACIHVLFRVLFWVAYYSGAGKVAGGPRTLCFIGGLLSNITLAVFTLVLLVKTV